MKELDLLKKDWKKKENAFEQISEQEIYRMIHKKSSSIVKWIFIISVLEVIFWITLSLIFNTDSEVKTIRHDFLQITFQAINYANYVVIGTFIYFFYKNYAKISATVSAKQLMKDILKTRKTVQYYVWYNLGILAFGMILGLVSVFSTSPETENLKEAIMKSNLAIAFTIISFVIIFIVFFGLFRLFYKVLYGFLLKQLHANYEELKKIDL